MSQPMMAAGFVTALLDYVSKKGALREQLLNACGLGGEDLSDQDNRVPVAAYQALIGAAIEAPGDTAILLRHTLESRLETMSVVGQIVHSSASLAHSIQQLNRYLHLMAENEGLTGRDRFELFEAAGEVWIVDHLPVFGPDYIGL